MQGSAQNSLVIEFRDIPLATLFNIDDAPERNIGSARNTKAISDSIASLFVACNELCAPVCWKMRSPETRDFDCLHVGVVICLPLVEIATLK